MPTFYPFMAIHRGPDSASSCRLFPLFACTCLSSSAQHLNNNDDDDDNTPHLAVVADILGGRLPHADRPKSVKQSYVEAQDLRAIGMHGPQIRKLLQNRP